MAKKPKTVFVCQECGNESPRWMGQCICGAWNSMVEEKVVETAVNDTRRRASEGAKGARPSKLKEVGSSNYSRIDTGIGELNRILGGGLVPGSWKMPLPGEAAGQASGRGNGKSHILYRHPKKGSGFCGAGRLPDPRRQ